nr:MAG TPA: hypothetical protein [Caudoviricetes sp.]
MSVIDTLITDRTQDDVDTFAKLAKMRWQDMSDAERATFNAGRGDYSADAMNRVGEAVNYLVARVNAAGGRIRSFNRTYGAAEEITESSSAEYLSAIATVRAAVAVFETTPAVPDSLAGLDYVKANNIEKILKDVDTLLTNAQLAIIYSGEVFAGEG